MNQVNELIGNNLKRLREERGYSIGKLAEIVGVSKSMLSQIEKGETNPSVGTIWKIANGLKVSFTSLLNEENSGIKVIRKDHIQTISEEKDSYTLNPYFPYNPEKKFEIYSVELEGDAKHLSEAHVKGVEEYFIVTEGEFEVTLGIESIHLKTGDAVTFTADKEHSYINLNNKKASGVIMLYYNE